ncbi:AraC family transcriptional regulator [Citricoccus sp. I39-566]|uniref:helix-turn-helix domain-containing protein n=1 Tax=Citricoccus sp. I39-566 TaxID=3073268 RepID=UPI00286B498B|nr:AraC family transcriptional regulator [Citricoccus sp. I39-566]WMY78101.1 AraC family transcriptional regulator [Citricoccus sp. I39-566]
MSQTYALPAPTGPFRQMPLERAGSVAVDFTSVGIGETLATATRWPDHSHAVHELLWNDAGASTLRVGRRTWTVTPAIGLWMPAGTVHSAVSPAGTRYRATYFTPDADRSLGLSGTGMRGETSPPAPPGAVPEAPPGALPQTPSSVRITVLVRELLDRLGSTTLRASSRRLTEAMVLDVLAPAPHQFLVHEPTAELLRPIVAAVLADPADARSLGDWSRQLRVSERTITRAFQTETGLGFARWVGSVRVQRATTLLADGEPLEDIAEAMGYRSASAFGAAFRKLTGTTPSSLRH